MSTYRVDWFDGSVTEDRRPASASNASASMSTTVEGPGTQNSQDIKEGYVKKAIGFRKLYEISQLEPPILNLELELRPGFWLLFSSDISDDFIVLIIKTLKTLYKSLNKNDSPKLLHLLETKFMWSDFFNKLHDYVKNLPHVKLSQKSRNLQLWNDANCFYSDLLEFYKGIFNFYKNRKEYMEQLLKVVEITDVSALGVEHNHSESISPNFHQDILNLQKNLKEILNDMSKPASSTIEINEPKVSSNLDDTLNPDDGKTHYQNLSIVPNFKYSTDFESVNSIKPNITDGAYASVEHYLDIQFKLLREDCYRTLKEGINQYRKYKTLEDCKDVTIRVYRKVFITDIKLASNRVGYVVDLNQSQDLKAYKGAKTFMYGSLLIFTHDNFECVLCGTVIASEIDKQIIVEFSERLPIDVFSHEYLMVESDVYFEPYHKVLKVLKNATPPIPMQKYIVYVDKQILPPAYLKIDTSYFIKDNIGRNKSFGVLYPEWPTSDEFGLDESQMEAFKFALTKEFVVIQGPPGTGKTYLGTKIAGMLLNNISFSESPMLVICSTNHALDQFLEGLLKFTNHIVRVGGQSKSEVLENYNLKNLRVPKTFSKIQYSKKKELDSIFNQLKTLAVEMEVYHNSILSFDTLRQYYRIDPNAFLDCASFIPVLCTYEFNNSEFLYWLLGIKCDSEDKVFNDLKICFSELIAVNEINKLKKEIQQLKASDFGSFTTIISSKEDRIRVLETTLTAFKEMMSWKGRHTCATTPQKLPRVSISQLRKDQRWYLYFRASTSVLRYLFSKKTTLYRQYLDKTKELDDLRDTMDSVKLRGMQVVGMTTTMAAARHGLLKKLKSFVVIVEEAAEVLEAHIVAALTNGCKHLILIGDHKQLRPNSAHYIIGKKYDLEVSLFERMVNNGVHSKTLTIQRRMREEIRDLLVPTIYEKLDCHPKVLSYPNIRGMTKNLYFFDHNNFEEIESNSNSYMNKFEAEWCVSLANYFVKLKYQPSEVTILATYTAQVALIIKLMKNYELIKDVHVTTVDNYQGEENRIVILSLVRSNAEKNVGFLGTANRVCVALSRAKEGLYIFGNMTCLETSAMWRTMKRKLQAQNAIGDNFQLIIENDTYEVGTTSELDNFCKTKLLD